MNPAEYLESLQEKLNRELGTTPNSAADWRGIKDEFIDKGIETLGIQDADEIAAARREMLAEVAEAEKTKPTKLEDINYHILMKGLAKTLEEAAEKTDWAVPPIPVYGTLPLGQLNAMAIRVPQSNQYLIAFQDGVFGFANLLTKAIAASFPVRPEAESRTIGFSFAIDDVVERWAGDDEPLRRLNDFLGGYLVGGHPHAAQQYFLDYPFVLLASLFRDAFELFIFGHEFGHILAGHLNGVAVSDLNLGSVEVERLSSNWQMEFEADYIGMALTMLAMRDARFDAAMSYCGIDLFFSAIELVSRALSVLVHGEVRPQAESSSHPPPALRREALRGHLNAMVGEEPAAGAIQLATTSEEILDLMWQRVEPSFRQAHEKGVQPAPMWRG